MACPWHVWEYDDHWEEGIPPNTEREYRLLSQCEGCGMQVPSSLCSGKRLQTLQSRANAETGVTPFPLFSFLNNSVGPLCRDKTLECTCRLAQGYEDAQTKTETDQREVNPCGLPQYGPGQDALTQRPRKIRGLIFLVWLSDGLTCALYLQSQF